MLDLETATFQQIQQYREVLKAAQATSQVNSRHASPHDIMAERYIESLLQPNKQFYASMDTDKVTAKLTANRTNNHANHCTDLHTKTATEEK